MTLMSSVANFRMQTRQFPPIPYCPLYGVIPSVPRFSAQTKNNEIALLLHSLHSMFERRPFGKFPAVLFDILVAVIIVVIAALLGIVVHPVLWVIVIAAALWLVGRSRTRGSRARI